jgi:hypothetical protein
MYSVQVVAAGAATGLVLKERVPVVDVPRLGVAELNEIAIASGVASGVACNYVIDEWSK